MATTSLRRTLAQGVTTQTGGMRRFEAISGKTVGTQGAVDGADPRRPRPRRRANHHHGASETAIYVVRGNPVFVFLDVEGSEPEETRLRDRAG